ncbi:hypothetical protein [Raineya orbicola]|uniref:hypothetical protein n=1 Tax=Raineya orbicola TaxID=2016530 RepID=UPI000C6EDB47|nr:hypothetical protein [Raineya orbicola]
MKQRLYSEIILRGKSSIARAISALFGNTPKANLKNKNTEPALVKLMSQASNCVIWFDEDYNEVKKGIFIDNQ